MRYPYVFASLLALSGCSKEQKAEPIASTTASAAASTPPSAESAPTAAPSSGPGAANEPPAVDAAPATSQPTAAGHGAAATGTTPATKGSASASTDAGTACGTKPLPDCPLQAWMKANTAPAMASSDFAAIATALDKIATFAPHGYTNWASISKDGAAAARANKLDAVKAACRGCHDQYRSKYRAELRARPISG